MFVSLRPPHRVQLTWAFLIGPLVALVAAGTDGRDGLRADETPVDTKSTELKQSESSEIKRSPFYACPTNDPDLSCTSDPYGYEAIHLLHAQIDDDQNGDVDRDESNEFLRQDLKLRGGSAERTDLHGSDDLISVQDMWRLWSNSDAYKWTVDEVVDWLTVHVELPQYSTSFRVNAINGRLLPRLASFSPHSLLSLLGIKSAVHRQKLTLKAADVVLFGPPKNVASFVKDFALVLSLFVAVSGGYFAYFQHRRSQGHLQKVMRDLKALQKAEHALSRLQNQLKKAQTEQQIVISAKHDVERKLKQEIESAKTEAERLRAQRETMAKEQISCLKLAEDELTQLRKALGEAERQLHIRTSLIPSDLQQWLQLTYEVETKYFEAKRSRTEQQLKEAREMCDKIRQKEKFLGSFHVSHSSSLDPSDDKIISVRSALEDVKRDLQERSYRWKEVENLCGFNIIINPGIPYLNSLLHRSRFISCASQTFQHLKKQSFLAIGDRCEDDPGSYLDPPCNDQQVLSNLMRAGMQLSVVGVNLSEMSSSRAPFRDSNPSPASSSLHECRSTGSLSSIGSFGALRPFGQQCIFSLATADACGSSGAALPSTTESGFGGGGARNEFPNGSGCFPCRGVGEINEMPRTTWSSSENTGQNSEKTVESDADQNAISTLENRERLAISNSKQERPKQKLPFSKHLKGSTGKVKSS